MDKRLEKDRLSKMINAIMKVARGDYSVQVELLGKNDDLDSLAIGINMMTDDIRNIITEHKRMVEKVKRLNLVLSVIRNVSQLITREKDLGRLFKSICDNLIENRVYHSAWITALDESGRAVDIAEAGLDKDFLPIVERLKRGELPDCGQRALKRSGVVTIDDPVSACCDCHLAKKHGKRGAMSVRLKYGTKVCGLLSVYFPANFIGGEEEQYLFKEIADDIAYAIHLFEVDEEKKLIECKLGERVKELGCLYGIAKLAEQYGADIDKILGDTVSLIPPALQYPDIICARITFNDQVFETVNFKETKWKQSSDIKIHREKVGVVEVCYLEEKPENDEEPFLKEERNLIDSIADSIGRITDHVQTEGELENSLSILRSTLESTADGILVVDQNQKIANYNQRWVEMFDIPESILESRNDHKLMGLVLERLKDPESFVRRTEELFAHPDMEMSDMFEFKDGQIFERHSRPYRMRGKTIGRVVSFRDITERKMAERKIKQIMKELEYSNEKLEQSNTDLENYTYMVTHDLKAPLRSLRSFSSFLLEDYHDKIDEAGQDYLKRIVNSVDHMDTLIEDLLLLSRVGRKFIDIEEVDLNDMIDEIKEDLEAVIKEHNAEIVTINKLPSIPVQKTWMKQLFLNLITNGLKFNNSKVPRIKILCDKRPEEYLFKIRDNGIGIEKKYHERIFNLFEKLHAKEEYEGTGAGLAICKRIVESFGGKIWVESKPGTGSTFFFTILKKIIEESKEEENESAAR